MKCKWCLFPHCFLVFGFCHCHSCHSHPFPSFPVIQVGGGGDKRAKCGLNEMFERMCAWDDQNYVMAAGTKAGRHVSCDRDGARSVERGQCRLFFVFFWDKGCHCIARFYQRCTCFFWRSVVISSDSFLRILWSVQDLTPTPPMALSTDMLTQWSPASTTSRELSSLTAACDGEGRGDISSL